MAASVKDIEVIIRRKLEKAVPQAKVNQANIAAQRKVVELWRKQLSDGIDEDGKRISKLSSGYQKFKRKYISGRIGHRKGSSSKSWYKDLYTTNPEYRAVGTPNYGRLTGKFFASMAVSRPVSTITDGIIKLGFKLFVNNKSRSRIMRYLEQQGRKYGFALGNSNRGQKHQKIIRETMLKILFPKATLFSATVRSK